MRAGKCLKFGSDTMPMYSIRPAAKLSQPHNYFFWFLHHHRVKIRYTFYVFSWEPALETLKSRDDEAAEDVKKKALQFSAINSDF